MHYCRLNLLVDILRADQIVLPELKRGLFFTASTSKPVFEFLSDLLRVLLKKGGERKKEKGSGRVHEMDGF